MSTRFAFRDGDRTRDVDVEPLGTGRFRVTVDGVASEVGLEALGDGRLRLLTQQGAVLADVTAAGGTRYVRVQSMDFVLEREAVRSRPERSPRHDACLVDAGPRPIAHAARKDSFEPLAIGGRQRGAVVAWIDGPQLALQHVGVERPARDLAREGVRRI